MSEEKKEEKKQETPKAQEKAEKKVEPKTETKSAAPAVAPAPSKPAAEAEGEPKKPKLSQLSLQEVEEHLKTCQEKMGGLHSKYARFLLRRKQILTQK